MYIILAVEADIDDLNHEAKKFCLAEDVKSTLPIAKIRETPINRPVHKYSWTLLHCAAFSGEADVLQALLSRADIEQRTTNCSLIINPERRK